jgi:hypothetical protein
VHFTIVEPFAGAAGYSLHYPFHRIKLYDQNELVCAVWDYLIHADPEEIRRLPINIEHLDDHNLTLVQKWLIGYWMNKAGDSPSRRPSQWMVRYPDTSLYWGEGVRERIAQQVPCIRHWTIEQMGYENIPDIEATWFVDEPYNNKAGDYYKYGRQGIDYQQLAGWCRSRKGQVIVCESGGAEWLDFRAFRIANGQRKQSAEVIWTNDGAGFEVPTSNSREGQESAVRPNDTRFYRQGRTVEWYTPPEMVEAARLVMGGIDLDPATTRDNHTGATTFYTRETDGRSKPWYGRVFLNAPYGVGLAEWMHKLIKELVSGRVTQVVCIIPARTDAGWFHTLCGFGASLCFPRPIKFINGLTGKQKDTSWLPIVIVYVGNRHAEFAQQFRQFGIVRSGQASVLPAASEPSQPTAG